MPTPPEPTAVHPTRAVTRAWVQLVRAQKTVLSAIDRDLKAASLPPLIWYDVLLELTRAEGGKLRPFEIEHRTLLAQHNLSRLLDRIEQAQLVQREPFSEDRRGRWVTITPAGRDMQARIWIVYAAAIQRHIGDNLRDDQAEQLANLLMTLSSNG